MIRSTHAGPRPTARGAGVSPLTHLIAPEALTFQPQHLMAGTEWRRLYMVTAFPPSVEAGWLARAANLPGVTLALHAVPQDAGEIVMALNRRIGAVAGQLAAGAGGGALVAQRLAQEGEDALALLRQIDAEQQGVYQTGVILMLSAPNPEEGLRRAKRLEATLGAAGMRVRPVVYHQEAGLSAAGPYGIFPDALRGAHVWPSATVAASWPFGASGINHGSGIVLGHDGEGGLVLINRWVPPADSGITNPNWTILAGSGAGKSHATKLMILREWAQGATVIVIDPEREYRQLCQALGGAWINAGGGTHRINPLQAPPLPADTDSEDDAAAHGLTALGQHLQRVRMVLSLYLPQLTPMQGAVLGRALRATYEQAGIGVDADPAAVPNARWPHIGHVYAVLQGQDDPDSQSLAALLEEAAQGADAPLWVGPSTPTPDSDLVVIDIHDLENAPDATQRAQYANLLGFAWDLVRRDRTERVVLVVDEAWMLIDPRAPEALSFLKRMAKRIRKYAGSLNVVTQNAVDFLAPEVAREGEPVLANASTKLLLRQEAKDLPTVASLFTLSDSEQDRLANAQVGEGLLIAGNQRVWVKVATAPHESLVMYGSGR